MSARYAVYLAPPPDSALWRFGSRVLGRDAVTGEEIEGFAAAGVSPHEWRRLTQAPRRYGFHATLKAPFRLARGRMPQDLEAAVAALAAQCAPFDLGPLAVTSLALGEGAFVALTPVAPPPELAALEARVVEGLAPFRAPLGADEIARRRPERLSPRQRELLALYGYPHVLDAFRLHFTLTGALADPAPIMRDLSLAFERATAPDLRVDALALFVEEGGASFRVFRRFVLGAA